VRAAPVLLLVALTLAACGSDDQQSSSSRQAVQGQHSITGVTPPHLQITHPAGPGVAAGYVFVGE